MEDLFHTNMFINMYKTSLNNTLNHFKMILDGRLTIFMDKYISGSLVIKYKGVMYLDLNKVKYLLFKLTILDREC